MTHVGGVSGPVPGEDLLRSRLAERMRRTLCDPRLEILTLREMTGGASTETWEVVASAPTFGSRRFALRLDRLRERREGQAMRESTAMREGMMLGVPVPAVVDWSDDETVLGAPFVLMDFLDGETIPRRILRNDEFMQARTRLVAEIGRAAARIHSVAPIPQISGVPSQDLLAEVEERYRSLGFPRPALELGLQWLVDHRPPAMPLRLVHGDFRLGNFLVGSDGLRGIIDWEFAHWGDPMEDLGFLCVPAWRWGGDMPVAGLGDYEELFRVYEAEVGSPVDRIAFRWWQILGVVRWGVGCLLQARRHLDHRARSIELVALGRRAAEQEMDLLRLLRGDI